MKQSESVIGELPSHHVSGVTKDLKRLRTNERLKSPVRFVPTFTSPLREALTRLRKREEEKRKETNERKN